MIFLALVLLAAAPTEVSNLADLRRAALTAGPGTTILVAPGEYVGGVSLADLHGAEGRPIVIAAKDPKNPPLFKGGGGIHLSRVSNLHVRDLNIKDVTGNGLNVDDGGLLSQPSRQVVLERITVVDTPKGNFDGIKLSGLRNFRVTGCSIQRWGGAAVDMVGCHEGVIEDCFFKSGGDTGVQAKGGSSAITIRKCRFLDPGQRGVNLGGSTGVSFFRPPLDQLPKDSRAEARDLKVEGCTFVGGVAAVAFVGVDGARVRFNTIFNPGRWALRILQETRLEGFVPCRGGVFEDNLVVFRSDSWASGGVNLGDGTAPKTFRFARNYWWCSDSTSRSGPALPTPESDGIVGRDPMVTLNQDGRVLVAASSPAKSVGAHAYRP